MLSGKVDSTSFTNIKQMLIKFIGFGGNDVRNYLIAGPYGDDNNPPAGMIALFDQTANGAQGVVVGYINKNLMTRVGEKRIFSTDSDGNLKGQVWLKNDGSAQSTSGCSPAVLGDKNKTALTDVYNAFAAVQTFVNICQSSPDPALAMASKELLAYLQTNLPTYQTDIDATESKNVALN